MLNDKLKDMKKIDALKSLPQYPSIETAGDLEEIWEKVIKASLPDKNIVIQWHKVLKEYVAQKNVSFCLRAYGSPSGNSPMLRRGFLNKVFSGGVELFETFYVDNSFPTYFYAMAKDGYAPKDVDELKSIILNRIIPCGFFHTKSEEEFSVYYKGNNPGMSKKGYKLAHIFSAGENYNSAAGYNKISEFCDSVFPRGDRDEWKNISSIGEYYRPIHIDDIALLEKIRNYVVAHFLRSVHPINYFLVPKKSKRDKTTGIMKTNIYWHDIANAGAEKDEIGEYTKLIEFVAAKIKDIYKDTNVYQEFLDFIYPTGNCIDPIENNVMIDAEYAIDIWKRKIGSTATATTVATTPGTVPIPTTKSKTKTRTIRKHPPVDIELIPSDPDVFEKELLNKKKAKITLIYKDGHTLVDNWDARRYTSNLMKRINDKLWNEPDRDDIVKAIFEV